MPRHASARFARAVLTLALLAVAGHVAANPVPRPNLNGAQIRLALERLGVVGSALYVGAHPDDENTALLAWLENGKKVRTAYLSLTRGDGGQNLIGSDTGKLLGVIRTQELLAARRVDGAEQMFTRALDFGFSKNADETLALWGHDRILGDVVWAIRSFRPDVIITRFPPDSSAGHGHHTASAMLAEEAFKAAADPQRFPGQLKSVGPWQATRLEWNAFRFGQAGPDTTPGRVRVDIGAYQPLLGRSYTEIAGESRSMHKTQGFGSAERRGAFVNTFEHRLGTRPRTDLFDGVDLTWSRVPGAEKLTGLFERGRREFDADRPQGILPILLDAWDVLAKLPSSPLVDGKRDELREVIRSCAGLWIDAVASAHSVSPGGTLRVVTTLINRSDLGLAVKSIEVKPGGTPVTAERALDDNRAVTDTITVRVADLAPLSTPFWLEQPSLPGSYEIADPTLVARPENPPAWTASFTVAILGRAITYDVPVAYRWVDPVYGERYRDAVVVPPASLRFDQGVYVFADGTARDASVVVQSAERAVKGAVKLTAPAGWKVEPAEVTVSLPGGEADTTLRFHVTPPAQPSPVGALGASFTTGGRTYTSQLQRLDYAHIPIQTLLPPAEARLVRTNVKHTGTTVGYVMGSGDQCADALKQLGYRVTALSDDDLSREPLVGYDAIVVGVRAYNTRPRLRKLQDRLLDYVSAGGRLVIQYQTPDRELNDRLGPYPFSISRDRVTVEQAPMTMKAPAHALLNKPNKIAASDFDGWVQERGLSFANPWDPKYEVVLSCNDPGEPARDGGLITTHYGKGVFIYTGFAWFRQLPAGVPGAYRLFANLVSPER
jgi:LmbE family N-acetylglucosaminyl deacetylase